MSTTITNPGWVSTAWRYFAPVMFGANAAVRAGLYQSRADWELAVLFALAALVSLLTVLVRRVNLSLSQHLFAYAVGLSAAASAGRVFHANSGAAAFPVAFLVIGLLLSGAAIAFDVYALRIANGSNRGGVSPSQDR